LFFGKITCACSANINTYKMGSNESKYVHPKSSIVVSPASDDAHSPVYRNLNFKEGLVPTAFPEVRTMYDAFQRGLKVNPGGKCMGSRRDTGKTKEEVDERGKKKVGILNFLSLRCTLLSLHPYDSLTPPPSSFSPPPTRPATDCESVW